MKKLSIVVTLFFVFYKVPAQTSNYEQKVVNYFFDSIFQNRYKQTKIVEFKGYTEPHLSNFKHYEDCLSKSTDSLRVKLALKNYGNKFESKGIFVGDYKNVKFKKINPNSKKRLKLFLSLANEVDNIIYVLLEITKKQSFTDAYMFELDKSGSVIRWCHTGMIY